MPSHLFRAQLPIHRPPTATGETQANGVNTPDQPPRSANTARSSSSLLTGLKSLKAGVTKFLGPDEKILKSQALRKAVRQGKTERVTSLLANGANPNVLSRGHGNGALHLAIMGGNPEMVRIVANHPTTNAQRANLRGQNAAHLVNASENQEMIDTLLSSSSYQAIDPSPAYDGGEGRTEYGIPPYSATPLEGETVMSPTSPQEAATHTPAATEVSRN